MLTFKASVANYTSVEKINPNCGYIITNHPAVVSELNPAEKGDICTASKIPDIWGNRCEGVSLITDSFEYAGKSCYNDLYSRYFAFTTQQENLHKLNPLKILGLMQTSKLDLNSTRIDNVQINPFYVYDNPYNKFLNVGTTFMKSIIHNIFPKDEITLYSPERLTKFFSKLGFEKMGSADKGDILMKLRR